MTYRALYNIITDSKIIGSKLLLVEKNKIHFPALTRPLVNGCLFKTITKYIIYLHNMWYRLGLGYGFTRTYIWRVTIICKTHLFYHSSIFFPPFAVRKRIAFIWGSKIPYSFLKPTLTWDFLWTSLCYCARCAIHFQQSL